jgi:hypothetical protein
MPYRWRRSLWAWRSLQRLWQRDTPEGALEAISAALVVTLVILVVTLVALAVSALPAWSRPPGATPLTAGTLLLGEPRGSHLMYGRVPRFGRGGVFLGYYYPTPEICNQYPGYYDPAVGCYGLEPLG